MGVCSGYVVLLLCVTNGVLTHYVDVYPCLIECEATCWLHCMSSVVDLSELFRSL